jgi:hypothetical protein
MNIFAALQRLHPILAAVSFNGHFVAQAAVPVES